MVKALRRAVLERITGALGPKTLKAMALTLLVTTMVKMLKVKRITHHQVFHTMSGKLSNVKILTPKLLKRLKHAKLILILQVQNC